MLKISVTAADRIRHGFISVGYEQSILRFNCYACGNVVEKGDWRFQINWRAGDTTHSTPICMNCMLYVKNAIIEDLRKSIATLNKVELISNYYGRLGKIRVGTE